MEETSLKVGDRIKMFRKSENSNSFMDHGDGVITGFRIGKDHGIVGLEIITRECAKLHLEMKQVVTFKSPNFYCKKY